MLTALIHTNRPTGGGESEGSAEASTPPEDDTDSDGDKAYKPSPVKRIPLNQTKKQSKLSNTNFGISSSPTKGGGRANATLVVAPMSLIGQWRDEIERCSNARLTVSLYYGTSRGDLEDELEDGTDVVITRYELDHECAKSV